jgi:hypothetical protein
MQKDLRKVNTNTCRRDESIVVGKSHRLPSIQTR